MTEQNKEEIITSIKVLKIATATGEWGVSIGGIVHPGLAFTTRHRAETVAQAIEKALSVERQVLLKKTADMISGAIYDFCGRLTTYPGTITLGSAHPSAEIIPHLDQWLKDRGLTGTEPMVENWNKSLEKQ